MYYRNQGKNPVTVGQSNTESSHLIDLQPVKSIFDQKAKGNNINHPKAGIRTLTAFFNKNGLSNLL
ncbi:hypothetical protein [Pedobacter alluvionis]|uniref:Uncharacterized protein n=1 Tax=Pedobacter alluvionis TaxID=475253 RepID=A0A497YAR7_9SPHI|nr:hypothetical protein [Pedobacter alluvionis]RLJ80664.1 hypothetical protein BCL90_1456 [Pedobacter alluvionis]TFB31918.1 hypothetical protein E3V97_15220 [Pedobacter alluvionis]